MIKREIATGLVSALVASALTHFFYSRDPSPSPPPCQGCFADCERVDGGAVTCEFGQAITVTTLGPQVVITCRCPGADAGAVDGGSPP